MKTPEEIKNWLRKHESLAYHTLKKQEALKYIEQLEEQIDLMKIQMHGDCGVCKHRGGFDVEGAIMSQRCYECLKKETRPNWEYEGLPEV